jgi:hypothetical protein
MKKTIIFTLLLFLPGIKNIAQVIQGPITHTDTLIGFQDIIIMSTECADDGGFLQHGLRLKPDYNTQEEKFSVIDFDENSYIDSPTSIAEIKSGVFRNIGQKDAWYIAWNKNNTLNIRTYFTEQIAFTDSVWMVRDTTSAFSGMQLMQGNNLHAADFRGDGTINLVAAYTRESEPYIAVFSLRKGLKTVFESEYKLPVDVNNILAITVNDFNGDPGDELVISYIDENEIYLQAFDIEGNYDFVPYGSQKIEGIQAPRTIKTLQVTSGDFDGDGKADIAMAYGMPNPCSINHSENNSGNCEDIRLYTFRLEDNLSTGDLIDPMEYFTYNTTNGVKLLVETGNDDLVSPLNLISGNLLNEQDGTTRDEIVLGAYNVFVFQADEHLELSEYSQFTGTKTAYDKVNQFISISNLDGLGTESLIIADNYADDDIQPFFKIQAIDYTIDNEVITHENILKSPVVNCNRDYSIVTGFFSGLNFKIHSNPEFSSWTKLVRPVVIMNTPPAHFDLIAGSVHDVNQCFGSNECKSALKYHKTSETSTEVSLITSSQGDWGFNAHVSAAVDVRDPVFGQPVLGVSGLDVSSLWGEGLNDVTTTDITESKETFSFKISEMQGRFSRDDAMLALVSDYEKWVYTVSGKDGDTLGEVVVVQTTADEEPRWIEGRESMILAGYIPTHEQSNFLSYRNTANMSTPGLTGQNPDIREIIAIGNRKSVNRNIEYREEIDMETSFQDKTATRKSRVETSSSFSIGIPMVGGFNYGDGSVAKEEVITSHTFEVTEGMSLVIGGFGTAADVYSYSFVPYYYWSKTGALVIDYLLDLSGDNFWLKNYGKENPGFIFPNRLDSLKISNPLDLITDMDEYSRTSSVFTLPLTPRSGDVIQVGALIHNLSLENTSDRVGVSFYLGNPSEDGILLADTSGNTLFYTEDVIGYQEFAAVSMAWASQFETEDRIYCVIDPENLLDERDEADNIGWAPVNRLSGYDSGGVLSTGDAGLQFGQLENRLSFYPNPARDRINFRYSGPDFSFGNIQILNLSGKVVKIKNFDSIGLIQGTPELYTGDLSPGLYILNFSTDRYSQQSKLMIK